MEDKLIETITAEMKSKHLTQLKLAELTGIPKSTIGDNLSGKTKISYINLAKIADVLGVTVEFLRFGRDFKSVTEHSDKMNHLLVDLEMLNDKGIDKVQDYVDDLKDNDKYLK